jgi:hypothetical protein
MTLKFTDGIEIDTSGEYRTLKLFDGWYLVGNGLLIPAKDETDALKMVNEVKEKRVNE